MAVLHQRHYWTGSARNWLFDSGTGLNAIPEEAALQILFAKRLARGWGAKTAPWPRLRPGGALSSTLVTYRELASFLKDLLTLGDAGWSN